MGDTSEWSFQRSVAQSCFLSNVNDARKTLCTVSSTKFKMNVMCCFIGGWKHGNIHHPSVNEGETDLLSLHRTTAPPREQDGESWWTNVHGWM